MNLYHNTHSWKSVTVVRNSEAGDVEGEEDGIQEGEGSAERMSDCRHGLGSVSVNPGHNGGENGVGNSV